MILDEKVKQIMEWQESIASYKDEYFFEIVHVYLGQIKTPFNKHDIVKSLSNFIRKSENKKNLISLLDDVDVKLLAAIKIIPDCTQQKLLDFINSGNDFSELKQTVAFFERMANLEDRLIIFHIEDAKTKKVIFKINPMLAQELEPYINSTKIFSENKIAEHRKNNFALSPLLIGSFISYINIHPELAKADGIFKKKNLNELEEIFGTAGQMQVLFTAMKNLSLIKESEKDILIDWKRIEVFSQQSFCAIACYLCTAAAGHFSRSTLHENAQLLNTLMYQIEGRLLTKLQLVRLGFLLKEECGKDNMPGRKRFASMMSKVFVQTAETFSDSGLFELVIERAISLGLIQNVGTSESGEEIFTVEKNFIETLNEESEEKLVSINAGNSVTIIKGLSLLNLISMMKFLEVKHFDTATVFELTKKSVMSSFDNGLTEEEICNALNKFSLYPVPQNLKINLQDWKTSFNSAVLYKGFVLKVSEENSIIVRKNPVLEKFIFKEIAPGIFILNFTDDIQAQMIIAKSGLDFIGKIQTPKVEEEIVPFTKVYKQELETSFFNGSEEIKLPDEKLQQSVIAEMEDALEKSNFTAAQKECLKERIKNKTILNVEQLRATSVRFEKNEATAMDHTGKIHLIESAMQSGALLYIEVEGRNEPYLGSPVSLNKKSEQQTVTLFLENLNTEVSVLISSAKRIKKIRRYKGFTAKAFDRW